MHPPGRESGAGIFGTSGQARQRRRTGHELGALHRPIIALELGCACPPLTRGETPNVVDVVGVCRRSGCFLLSRCVRDKQRSGGRNRRRRRRNAPAGPRTRTRSGKRRRDTQGAWSSTSSRNCVAPRRHVRGLRQRHPIERFKAVTKGNDGIECSGCGLLTQRT